MIKIIIDTNILVSAQLDFDSASALILGAVFSNKAQLFVSNFILTEYENVLKRTKFGLSTKRIKRLISKIKRNSISVVSVARINRVKDEADNRFLECALAAEADFIITGNKNHFYFSEFRGIKIVSPREFIEIAGIELAGLSR